MLLYFRPQQFTARGTQTTVHKWRHSNCILIMMYCYSIRFCKSCQDFHDINMSLIPAGMLPEEPNPMLSPGHDRNVEASDWKSIASKCEDWRLWYFVRLGRICYTDPILHCERGEFRSSLPANASMTATWVSGLGTLHSLSGIIHIFFLWVLSANVCKTRFKNGWLADWADYNSSLAWRRWDITLSNNIKPHSTTLRILKIYIDLSWSIWPVLICFGKLLNTTSGSMEVMVTSCDITSRNVLTCSALPSVARDLTHGLWTTLSDYHLG